MDQKQIPAFLAKHSERVKDHYNRYLKSVVHNENTRESYQRNYEHFFAFCNGRVASISKISTAHVQSFVTELNSRYSPPSVRQHVASIRSLFDYFYQQKLLDKNPAGYLDLPRATRKAKSLGKYPRKDFLKLMHSIDASTLKGKRNRAIIAVLMDTQMRPGQLVKLKFQDLKIHKKICRIDSPRNSSLNFAFTLQSEASLEVLQYVESARLKTTAPLFQSFGGNAKNLSGFPLDVLDIWRMLKVVKKKLKNL